MSNQNEFIFGCSGIEWFFIFAHGQQKRKPLKFCIYYLLHVYVCVFFAPFRN